MVSKELKEQIINDYNENYLSLSEISKKYNIKSKSYISRYILGGQTRNFSEANRIAHKKHLESYKQSEETKDKIRQARLKWMKEHPEQTAWRLKNMSYPEKCFKKILEDNGLDKKHLIYREYSVFPYFIDFAFINEKLAVEIDGSQHLEEARKRRDKEKDKLLASKGWRVLRIAATEVTHDGTRALDALIKMLGNTNIKSSIVGILKAPKTHQKAVRGEDGLTDKQREKAFKQRKANRPSKEELWELVKTNPFETIGKMYGINGNSVKKWCKQYSLPHRKKDIDQLIDKQHKYSKETHICLYCGKKYSTDNHSSKFCCNDCYKQYIKENGLVDKENRKKSYLWVYKSNENGIVANKRVGNDEVEEYISQGWIRGRKLS